MIQTHLPPMTTELSARQRAFLRREGYTTFGCTLTQAELYAARHAFERVQETQDCLEDPATNPRQIHRTGQYAHEPALMALIGNPTVLAIVQAALGTLDVVYTGGYMARTNFHTIPKDRSKGPGWHADMFLRPGCDMVDDRVAVWIYMDDVTADEGATALISGTTPLVRALAKTSDNTFQAVGKDPQLRQLMRRHDALPDEEMTLATAPAGGGFAFQSFVLHKLRYNVSGVPRRLITMDFGVRGSSRIWDEECFFQRLSPEEQQRIVDLAPPAARRVLRVGSFEDHFAPMSDEAKSAHSYRKS